MALIAALGMLSTIATGLAIDAYGPISDNAGGIAEMAGMSHSIRERTDALDAAGNTTAAIGKGFAIGSAALVSLALFGAYVSRAGIKTVDVLAPKVFIGLIVGAMLPYWFSAMTMKSVGSAALKMVEEAGATEHARSLGPKGSDAHKAGYWNAVGDPLKDTSGPSLNSYSSSSWLLNLFGLPKLGSLNAMVKEKEAQQRRLPGQLGTMQFVDFQYAKSKIQVSRKGRRKETLVNRHN
ncbi:hypothetical protein HAX54_007810 [Datura stramonium]|uniref:H(+)-exporting diphosphatase n=1 Tax=Datura stramonium TaxID=4076 RepID=A0ABS8RKF4_DATST|nr:hypothetical protein [Datura stramonium]